MEELVKYLDMAQDCGLLVEVVDTAIKYAQSNPSTSSEKIMLMSLSDWDIL